MAETREIRIKRLRMRAWHRGIKEMDLILGGWADAHLAALDDTTLDAFEAVLAEADHDLYSRGSRAGSNRPHRWRRCCRGSLPNSVPRSFNGIF
jgi:succinate dehydrogenase flavin-adding protein (antitoxin of CptAB toxin-antitoxin module)